MRQRISNRMFQKMRAKVFRQLLREFSVPLILSIGWVAYNIYGTPNSGPWEVKRIINVFGPTFFLVSWLSGQLFRVLKQERVEENFKNVEKRLIKLIEGMEDQSTDFSNRITGGDSFPHFAIGNLDSQSNAGLLTAIHNGQYPLYDVSVSIVDLKKFLACDRSGSYLNDAYTNINIGNMIPLHALTLRQWIIEDDNDQGYNIFCSARNGIFVQMLRFKKIDGQWVAATQVKKFDQVLYEKIDNLYPRGLDGAVLWD